jgi:hypothetical protein
VWEGTAQRLVTVKKFRRIKMQQEKCLRRFSWKIMYAKSFCGFGVGNKLKITFAAISLKTAKRAINCDHFRKSS